MWGFGVRTSASTLGSGYNLKFLPTQRTDNLFSASASYVGPLSSTPGYVRLDTRLGWRPEKSVELSLIGQNLQTSRHAEDADAYFLAHTLIQRRILGTVTWRFGM